MPDGTMLEIEQLVELLKFDYEQTMGVVDGTVRVCSNVRTLAIAVWTGLIAAEVQVSDGKLAIVAAASVVLFAVLDGYHGWLYKQSSARAYGMEGLLGDYYKLLQRRVESHEVNRLLTKLRQHKYGQLRHFAKHSWGFYFQAKPYAVYWFLYPALLILAVVVASIAG
jgi:hypothetical protein